MSYAPVDIPELRFEVLVKFISKFTAPPQLAMTPMLGTKKCLTDTITWQSVRGSRGLAPFIAPGSPSPTTAPSGVAEHSAKAAFMSEKISFGEEFINNMKKPGTIQKQTASQKLATEYANLVNRSRRRKEWMIVKMICEGKFEYSEEGGTKLSVDYQLPKENQVSLVGNDRWGEVDADILGNIMDVKTTLKAANNGQVDIAIINSSVLKLMAKDPQIAALLRKDAFGDGSLYSGAVNNLVGVNPKVIAGLLDIPQIMIYDEAYEVRSFLTAPVIGGTTTTISVENPTDFSVGAKIRFMDVSAGTYEDVAISAVNIEAATLTINAAPVNTYRAGEDYVMSTKMFVPDYSMTFLTRSVEGEAIFEWIEAPFGIPGGYGLTPKSWMTIDPDVAWVRAQDKGLPVLYHRDAIIQLKVR